ncbi:ABC transporter ATP-binding protein [Microlunatus soli]|uniref:Glutathione import ATP-binding protein GsiA n=1 Tax=Microlunatus soli TaxID=630515 RepID=A0A1H1MVS0_9ACTN|nr:ABC transporter ATP-binding protein [Microlunatus soli]SDR90555.1 peptide/nickel transport system ATP-binding protein [Microlunatus soli]
MTISNHPTDTVSDDRRARRVDEHNLLELLGVSKEFTVRTADTGRARLSAVDGVSLTVRSGRTLGVVGESGCGKSTLARVIVGLHRAAGGEMIFDGAQVAVSSPHRKASNRMQMVFQDPSSALNPRITIGDSIAFPLRVQRWTRRDTERRVTEVIKDVGLPPAYANSYPHQLSGGQRQRVNIARALAVKPSLIVLDEAVSALDKSIQAQVLNLLTDLQDEYGLTYVFISHDLNVVEYISDDVLVMYLGQAVEQAPAAALYAEPLHPYTQLLLSSIPELDPTRSSRRQPLDLQQAREKGDGELPSPIDPPTGCRFRTRCPFAMDICAQRRPQPVESRPGHQVACHLYASQASNDKATPQSLEEAVGKVRSG